MKYGERLRKARKHADLTQTELAARAKVGTQENVSKLERADAEGSEFTVHYAIACGVRSEWLALESGEMVEANYLRDPRLQTALIVMEKLPDYAIDRVLRDFNSTIKLIEAAKADRTETRDNSAAANTAPARLRAKRRRLK